MKKRTRKLWTAEADKIILEKYHNTPTSIIAKELNRTNTQVYNRAHSLGLKKSEEYLKELNKELGTALAKANIGKRFEKGHTPANKGKKQSEYMSANAIARTKNTRFKKGSVPSNVVPVGTISERRNERRGTVYLYIKEKEHHWEQLHRHVWKNHYGEIPKGHNIIFKDGNTLNCEIDNLECVSDEKNMLRNSIQRYPEELRDVMQLTGRLKKKIIKKNSEKTV